MMLNWLQSKRLLKIDKLMTRIANKSSVGQTAMSHCHRSMVISPWWSDYVAPFNFLGGEAVSSRIDHIKHIVVAFDHDSNVAGVVNMEEVIYRNNALSIERTWNMVTPVVLKISRESNLHPSLECGKFRKCVGIGSCRVGTFQQLAMA